MQIQHQEMLDELAVFLDARQAELVGTLDRLGALREAVIRRDEATLSGLLEQVIEDGQEHQRLDRQQAQLQRRLTDAFALRQGPVTLSGLCACLDETRRQVLRDKQQTLQALAERVRRETESAELLLRECARCNRMLLGALVGHKNQTTTYDPQGHTQWDVHGGLVSTSR